jgi:hypothetical protein
VELFGAAAGRFLFFSPLGEPNKNPRKILSTAEKTFDLSLHPPDPWMDITPRERKRKREECPVDVTGARKNKEAVY